MIETKLAARWSGPSLSRAREARGLTQDQCARAVGLSRQRWSQLENAAAERMTDDVVALMWRGIALALAELEDATGDVGE
jgi:transcriptional regulator with XRE-family HTH domain